jgi:2-oxoisovalerate ferredoxin oxidoreductase beta subunit
MIPSFPLNVFRDRKLEIPPGAAPPLRPVSEVLEIRKEEASGPSAPYPHAFEELTIKLAGFGGQGVLLLGQLLAEMGMREGLEVSWLPSYGPEMRSGSANCHVCLSTQRIGTPLVSRPQVLIAMTEISLRKFASQVAPGGLILYSSDRLPENFTIPLADVICVPASQIADKLGSAKATNIVMLGAMLAESNCLTRESALRVLEAKVKDPTLLEIDRQALAAGWEFVNHQAYAGAVAQADGFAY